MGLAGLMVGGAISSGCTDLTPLAEPRRVHPPCVEQSSERLLLFGDIHAHSAFSFDASSYEVRSTPADAYRFARGEPIELPPYDDGGRSLRTARLDRPLDFAGLTEHSEFLGETYLCTSPGSSGYDTKTCQSFRDGVGAGASDFGFKTAFDDPKRFKDLCGDDGSICLQAARERWSELQRAADEAYDWTESCTFTTLVGYEYTNTVDISNRHRNVFFRTDYVPELPTTFFEADDPMVMLETLRRTCRRADSDCDVLSIPHNSNLSNGNLFYPHYADHGTPAEQAEVAGLRAEMEPLGEVFQHKGDMECRNGVDPTLVDDPLCTFEKVRPADDEVCGDEPGTAGMRLGGCIHRLNFLRNVLLEGLREEERIGINPYRIGMIGSTDTHNATPGLVSPVGFPGHVGLADDTPEKRLGAGNATHDGIINNPGGLVAVWAEQNTREDVFDALMRREVYATTGPRISLRLFAGWSYPQDLCQRDDAVTLAYDQGVPMGSVIEGPGGSQAPVIYVRAERDGGTAEHPGSQLQQLQIIKGWIAADGGAHVEVVDVAGDPESDASVATDTCIPEGDGADSLCAVWTDPEFDAARPAFYYARVVENPSCRWSTRQCNELGADAPPICSDPSTALTVRQRAWSSPIWYARP
jgi:hypothetical protein